MKNPLKQEISPEEGGFVPLPVTAGAGRPEGTWPASPTGSGGTTGFGALAAGLAGEEESFPEEEQYWRENHFGQPYGLQAPYEKYASAYRLGSEAFAHQGRSGAEFDDLQEDLQGQYAEGGPPLVWEEAEPAVRAAWNRAKDRWAARSG